MNDLRRIGAFCLLGLSMALIVGGSFFFASGADGGAALSGDLWLFVLHIVGDSGFCPMIGLAGMLCVAALFVYPWRLPVDTPTLMAHPAEPGDWPPAPTGLVIENAKQSAHHWARPDPEED